MSTIRTWQAVALLVMGAALGWILPRIGGEARAFTVDPSIVALVGETPVTREELEAAAPVEFLELARTRHELSEQHLDRAIQIKLVRMEADARGTTPEDLVREEVDGRVTEPTTEEIGRFYEAQGLQDDLDAIAPQIRTHLLQQARTQRYSVFLTELSGKYGVEKLLEPLRTPVRSDGFPAKGAARPVVTIVEFADFECPYCQQLIASLDRVMEAYADDVRLVYRQFPLNDIHADAQKAAEASLCAADQDRFWELHDVMFADQSALDEASVRESAAALGLDMRRYDECLATERHAGQVAADLEEGRSLGVSGTPTLFINGRFLSGLHTAETIAAIIDDELQRAGRPVEGTRLEPLRVEVETEGFPWKGAADAAVTIVEFADFQCPFCFQIVPTLERVMDVYGDRVRFVYRHFPLSRIHPDAQKSAEASMCAHEQGRFWEMHDALYADQTALGVDGLKRTARTLQLDGPAFDACLDSDRYAEPVLSDLAAGRAAGVRGTPTLFINGRTASGLQSFEALSGIIEDELQRAGR